MWLNSGFKIILTNKTEYKHIVGIEGLKPLGDVVIDCSTLEFVRKIRLNPYDKSFWGIFRDKRRKNYDAWNAWCCSSSFTWGKNKSERWGFHAKLENELLYTFVMVVRALRNIHLIANFRRNRSNPLILQSLWAFKIFENWIFTSWLKSFGTAPSLLSKKVTGRKEIGRISWTEGVRHFRMGITEASLRHRRTEQESTDLVDIHRYRRGEIEKLSNYQDRR